MPRRARMVFEGMPHHVVQRGNYRQTVFECLEDFQRYGWWIKEYSEKYGIEIVAYCLMKNHVHFIVIPTHKDVLSVFFKTVHMRYAQYKHTPKAMSGHLWQARFFSCVLDDAHLLRAVRYVERNPVRAHIVDKASDYIWSSARYHMDLHKDPIIKTTGKETIPKLLESDISWKEYLGEEDHEMEDLMKEKTQKGQVLCAKENVSSIEKKFGIILESKKMKAGRPKK